jgi:hypothetical protein
MLDVRWTTAVILASSLWRLSIAEEVDYSQFVNPFIGSEGAIRGYACMRSSLQSANWTQY